MLAGFASAIFLLGIATLMAVTSVERYFMPQPIQYLEAIPIAIVGLIVNIICALILGGAHHHGHDRDEHHQHENGKHGHDLNLRSAYIHVVADAATSVLAITALTGGLIFGWAWPIRPWGSLEREWWRLAWGLIDRQAVYYSTVRWTIGVLEEIRGTFWNRRTQRMGRG